MIPHTDLEVDPSFPGHLAMGMPAEDEVDEEGYGFFRGVWDISGASLRDAWAVIEEERRLADLVDQATATRQDFEAVAGAVEDGSPDDLPEGFAAEHPQSEILEIVGDGEREMAVLNGLEIGVAGLAYALSAIGCFPAASCRSHDSESSWSVRPVVFFAAERTTVHWLTPLVRESGCGFGDGSGNGQLLITIEASSITNLMDLARRIVTQAERQQLNR